MSDRFSAANLKFPGDDARLDFTDLLVFQAPGDPGKTVFIIDANPFLTGGPAFHPDAVHRINIDNDGDLHADAAFTFTFSQPTDGRRHGNHRGTSGDVSSDPFFADAEGALHAYETASIMAVSSSAW
jgi:hypothetical protein